MRIIQTITSQQHPSRIHPAPLEITDPSNLVANREYEEYEKQQLTTELCVQGTEEMLENVGMKSDEKNTIAKVKGRNTNQGMSKRVSLPVVEPFVTDTTMTLGVMLFGRPMAKTLYTLLKIPVTRGILSWGLVLADVVTILGMFNLIDGPLCLLCLCGLPMLFLLYTTLNVKLLPRILSNFDALLSLAYSTVATLSVAATMHFSWRSIPVFIGWFVMILMVFSDAAPGKLRRDIATYAGIFLFIYELILAIGYFMEFIPDINNQVVLSLGKMSYTSADIAFISLSNCALFISHLLYIVFAKPGCYLFIVSRMRSMKVEEEKVKVLTTFHQKLGVATPKNNRKSKR
ncbi:hypothetical protein TrVE_jg12359 [Triparma verrucosa]|uniref:Transmembrane protein n=1 Tax=Triparma verrucosa TaxID=1606542 RepID=A0A9W7KRD7_9STRA|nr:hypothetical protein TrVE_jg12359 [Triparma verrucosa]